MVVGVANAFAPFCTIGHSCVPPMAVYLGRQMTAGIHYIFSHKAMKWRLGDLEAKHCEGHFEKVLQKL